jgi:3',5'-cyclic AMP phosphodiesterase CpdA
VPAAPGLLRLGENVIAVEVHPGGRRDAPMLAIDIAARRDLGIVRGPILGDIGVSSAVIHVETDPNLGAVLEWGAGAKLEQTITSEPGRVHTFTLSGLPVRSKISYRVTAGGAKTPVFMLQTAPTAGDVVRIGVYGDVRGGHDVHRRLIDAMLGEPLDLVTVTGDMVLRGSDEADWQRFFAITRELLAQMRYLPAIGNHDLGWSRTDPDVFALPPGPAGRPERTYWYSLDLADLHLVFLDSNAYERSEQEHWLDADLTAARRKGARAIIAFTHDGPYSRGIHKGNTTARDRYAPILARHHVDLLIAGHDHLYQRGEHGGLRYMVSGGGGASLYKISCGERGKPRCPEDGMQRVMSEHHFIVLTVSADSLEMCPRRSDGKLLEPCQRYPLWRP